MESVILCVFHNDNEESQERRKQNKSRRLLIFWVELGIVSERRLLLRYLERGSEVISLREDEKKKE